MDDNIDWPDGPLPPQVEDDLFGEPTEATSPLSGRGSRGKRVPYIDDLDDDPKFARFSRILERG